MEKTDNKIMKIAVTALMAALCFIAFNYLQIPIPLPGGDQVALHVGNAFCVLAALLLGGLYGGLAGSIGMTLADLLNPAYVTSAPKTFILKMCIGLIAGLIAHKIGRINESSDTKHVFFWTLMACLGSLGFNVIFDPIFGYFYKTFILGVQTDVAKIVSTWAAGVTAINAAVCTVVVTALYMALRPALKKSGLMARFLPSAKKAGQ